MSEQQRHPQSTRPAASKKEAIPEQLDEHSPSPLLDSLVQRAIDRPSTESLTPQVILALQRTHGNQFVSRLLQRARTQPPTLHSSPKEKIIQRKVGFEFESRDNAYFYKSNDKEKTKVSDLAKVKFGKGTGYHTVGDDFFIEIVTDAVDETKEGREQLQAQILNVKEFINSFDGGDVGIQELDGGSFNLDQEAMKNNKKVNPPYNLDGSMGVNFHPQATVGVRLVSLYDLMAAFTDAPYRGEESSTKHPGEGKAPSEYAGAVGWDQRKMYRELRDLLIQAKQIVDKLGIKSPKVKGLMFLLASYAVALDSDSETLKMLKEVQRDIPVKFFMVFMARSFLVSVINQGLDAEEKLELAEAGEKITKRFSFSETPNQFGNYFNLIMLEHSVGGWLETLTQSSDKDRRDNIQEQTGASYGAIHRPSKEFDVDSPLDIGTSEESPDRKRMDGIILELRTLGAQVTNKELMDFSLNVFDLVRAVHVDKPPEKVSSKRREKGVSNIRSNSNDDLELVMVRDEVKKEEQETRQTTENCCKDCCFITTACVQAKGLPDDCYELRTLRHFRDTYMRSVPGAHLLLEEYYRIAPVIVQQIHRHPKASRIWEELYEHILYCVQQIEQGELAAAFMHYCAIVLALKKSVLFA